MTFPLPAPRVRPVSPAEKPRSTHRLRASAINLSALVAAGLGGCFGVEGPSEGASPPSSVTPERFHPAGYAAALFHGIDANLQATDCRECHGAELLGGDSEVSCDTAGCHSEDWRSDCTYCHGGDASSDGAPPRNLDGTVAPELAAFGAHATHLVGVGHPNFACTECHAGADEIRDILTPGHAFDVTRSRAEVNFGGLSAGGTYDASTRTCSNVYCHGNGARNGSVAAGDEVSCTSCHPSQGSSDDAWEAALDDEHEEHLEDGIRCVHCHGAVVDEGTTLIEGALHVNGRADWFIAPSLGILVDAQGRCSGQCHIGEDEDHEQEDWD